MVGQGHVDVDQVQGDALYVKPQAGTVWIATAMRVFSRLFLWGVVAPQRDTALVTQVITQVRAAAQVGCPSLWAVDGFAAWANLHNVQVVKQYTGRTLTGVDRRLTHGCMRCAQAIMQATQVTLGVINTAYIERLNATFRT